MSLAIHTLDEAAEILRVKPSWLERQAAARKIPFTMLGGSYRFTAEHLATIVSQHEIQPDPAAHLAAEPVRRKPREVGHRTDPQTGALRARPLAPRNRIP